MKGCWTLIAALMFAAPAARAQELGASGLRAPSNDANANAAEVARAKRAFETGQSAFAAGRFAEAADSFDHAYALSGRPELLFDLGLAADRLRDDERALAAFQRFLEMSQDNELREQVEQRVAALKAARDRKREQDEAAQRQAQLAPAHVAATAVAEPTARPSQPLVANSSRGERDTDDDGGVLSQWWFWTGAAVLIAGGAATAYVLTREPQTNELPTPNSNIVVSTLRFAP